MRASAEGRAFSTSSEPTLVKLFASLLAHKLWVVRQSAVHSVYPLLEGLSEGQSGVLQQFTDMATDT